MTPPPPQPLFLGLCFLAAGLLFLVVFVLPGLVFPREEVLPPPVDAAAPPPPAVDFVEKIERAYAPLASRLTALETKPAPVPTAGELRQFYEGLDGLKRGLDDVKSLAAPLSTGAQNQQALSRQVESLARQAGVLPQGGASSPAETPSREEMEDARRSRDGWLGREGALKAEAAALAGGEARSLESLLARETSSAETGRARRERAGLRLSRRLAAWRGAWERRLAREEAALFEEKKALESRRESLFFVSDGGEKLAEERRRLEEDVRRPAEARKTVLEGEIGALRERAETLRREIAALEERRSREGASAAEGAAVERRRAREDQSRWKNSLKRAADEASVLQAREEESLAALREKGILEGGVLGESLRKAREALEKDRVSLAAAEAALRAASEGEAAEASRRVEDLKAQVTGLEKTRDLLAETLRRELEEHGKEMAALRAWAAERSLALQTVSSKASVRAAEALEEVRARKAVLAEATARERESGRRDLSAFEAEAAAERDRSEGERRRLEGQHRERLAALSREEAGLQGSLADLEEKTAALKAQALRLREKARDRLFRRRAVHEKLYAEARQRAEARTVEDGDRLSTERAALASLEARLEVRRRRLASLRERRREALSSLMERAQSALAAAVEAHGRTEDVVRGRLLVLSSRSEAWGALKERWTEAPRRIREGVDAEEARIEMSAAGEMAGLLADAERRGEESDRLFAENREALERAAERLRESEALLDGDETGFRTLLNAVEAQALRLERLRGFFQALRVPAASAESRSEVA